MIEFHSGSSLIFIYDGCNMQVYVLAQLLTDVSQFSWASLVMLMHTTCIIINILMQFLWSSMKIHFIVFNAIHISKTGFNLLVIWEYHLKVIHGY